MRSLASLPRPAPALALIPAGAWTIVMGCGIVSIDLLTIGEQVLSAVVAWFAIAVWLVLAARAASAPARTRRESGHPAVLASVAGTAVLGARVADSGHNVLAGMLLALAGAGLVLLILPVLAHWETPTAGTSFLVSVAVQGIAVLSAVLAPADRAGWLLAVAAIAWLAGLVLYAVVAWKFEFGSVRTSPGDHWVAGGALAIATLAIGKITASATVLGDFGGWQDVLADLTLAVWCLAMAWLVVLVVSEAARPRLTYDVRRWATVFPLGMYAACGFAVAQVTGIAGITGFARAWTWVAVAVTLVVFAGLIRRAWRTVTGRPAKSA